MNLIISHSHVHHVRKMSCVEYEQKNVRGHVHISQTNGDITSFITSPSGDKELVLASCNPKIEI